jgi:hypothetical protein
MAGLGTGMASGLGGMGDEGQSADQQLQIGLQLIQQSYSRRVGPILSMMSVLLVLLTASHWSQRMFLQMQ